MSDRRIPIISVFIVVFTVTFTGCRSGRSEARSARPAPTVLTSLEPAVYHFIIPMEGIQYVNGRALRVDNSLQGRIDVARPGKVEVTLMPGPASPAGSPVPCGGREGGISPSWAVRASGDRILIECGSMKMQMRQAEGFITSGTASVIVTKPTGQMEKRGCKSYAVVTPGSNPVCVDWETRERVRQQRTTIDVVLTSVG